jgi:predicted lipoprotein with Yx(FWY)xxD motif
MIFRSVSKGLNASTHPRLRRPVVLLVACVTGFALAGLAGFAAAKGPSTLGTSKNSMLDETIVVSSRGLTLYELRPETTHHLLCTKVNGCFGVWLPLTVPSAKTKLSAARGVSGKLGVLHRNGFFQVALDGHPLYRFAGDASKQGAAGGQGIHSFGGTWHVVVVASSPDTTSTTTPTVTTPTMTTPTMTTPYYPPGY